MGIYIYVFRPNYMHVKFMACDLNKATVQVYSPVPLLIVDCLFYYLAVKLK